MVLNGGQGSDGFRRNRVLVRERLLAARRVLDSIRSEDLIPSDEVREGTPAMERAVDVFGACGTAIRIPRTRPSGLRRFGRTHLVVVAAIVTGLAPHRVRSAPAPAPPASPSGAAARRSLLDSGRNGLPRNILAPIRSGEPMAVRPTADSTPPPSPAPVAVTGSTTDLGSLASQRFKVRVPSGQCVVARYHGQFGRDTALILPDGQLGVTKRLIPTEQPFQPLTSEQLQTVLLDGPFADYHLLKTDHYLIFYKSSIASHRTVAGCSRTFIAE